MRDMKCLNNCSEEIYGKRLLFKPRFWERRRKMLLMFNSSCGWMICCKCFGVIMSGVMIFKHVEIYVFLLKEQGYDLLTRNITLLTYLCSMHVFQIHINISAEISVIRVTLQNLFIFSYSDISGRLNGNV
jgi:hypothetical protein